MDEEKLKEILIQLNKNIDATKDFAENHYHVKDSGSAYTHSYGVKEHEEEYVFNDIYNEDIEEIFNKKKDEVIKK